MIGALRNCYLPCSQPIDFTKEDAELLFGKNADYKEAFEELDTDEDGEVLVVSSCAMFITIWFKNSFSGMCTLKVICKALYR